MHGDERLEGLNFVGEDGLDAEAGPDGGARVVVPGVDDKLCGEGEGERLSADGRVDTCEVEKGFDRGGAPIAQHSLNQRCTLSL